MRHMISALALLFAAGCQNPGGTGTGDMATSPDLTTSGLTWTTRAVDIQTMKPLTGVNICIAPANTVCGMSDSNGSATVPVPMNSEFMLSYTLQDYALQFTQHSSATVSDGNGYLMVSTINRGVLIAAVGEALEAGKGTLVFTALDANSNPVSGVTYAATPQAGKGPFYFGAMLPDRNATSTSSNGLGFVINLPPADYDVTAMAPGKTCTRYLSKSWAGATAASTKARAIADGINTVSFLCQ